MEIILFLALIPFALWGLWIIITVVLPAIIVLVTIIVMGFINLFKKISN